MIRVGADVGGTHTDLVLIDDATSAIAVNKLPTSVHDPAQATVAGLVELAGEAGVAPAAIGYFMHGTTIATNIIIEHAGARTGLITTAGFRDVLHIARHKRPYNFSVQLELPWQKHPLVQRRYRLTVAERINGPLGEVAIPLDEDGVRAAARELRAEGVEAIAVCFMMSFLNPVHELRAAEIVREEHPDAFVTASHQVVGQYREYERFSTACLNAYVGPRTAGYIERLDAGLRECGVDTELHLMQSNGGSATARGATERPVSLLMSGPVGGLLGGIWVGRSAGALDVISLDVGGTSADIGVAPGGRMRMKHLLDTRIGDYHAMVPMADVDTIGAGGGSIAYVDAGGQFQVGPRSAGADPGPCCYGRGGTEPTATDCLLVLGRVNAENFLGGRLPLDPALSHSAVERALARPLGMSVEEAALGAIRILTHNMVHAIEESSVRKGYDPRDFALAAFGGAGPLFACEIAAELSIPRVIVPLYPGLTSAIGLLTADLRYEFSRTELQLVSQADIGRIAGVFAELQEAARRQLEEDGLDPEAMVFVRQADCRYRGQGYELCAPVADGAIDAGFLAALRRAFDAEHRREYGSCSPEKEVQLVNLRVVGIGRGASLRPPEIDAGDASPGVPPALRPVVFDTGSGVHALDTPHFPRAALLAGNRFTGPAVIEQADSTTVIPPGFTAGVDRHANIVITKTEACAT